MGVKASPEVIREMKQDLGRTIQDLQKISDGIRNGMRATASWDDEKAAQFNMLMQQIARLTEGPIDTLRNAQPKLERLAQSLDEYNSVRF